MRRKLSEFHYTTLFIDAESLSDREHFHEEVAFKLGLPDWYGRNFDALLDCLSSISDPQSNLCGRWKWQAGKHLVLSVRGFSKDSVNSDILIAFLEVVADANQRLSRDRPKRRIWTEFRSPDEEYG